MLHQLTMLHMYYNHQYSYSCIMANRPFVFLILGKRTCVEKSMDNNPSKQVFLSVMPYMNRST